MKDLELDPEVFAVLPSKSNVNNLLWLVSSKQKEVFQIPLLSGRFSKLPKPNFHLISSLIVHLIPKRGIYNFLS